MLPVVLMCRQMGARQWTLWCCHGQRRNQPRFPFDVNLLTLLLAAVQPILGRFGNVRDVYSLVLPDRLHQTDLGVSNHLVQIPAAGAPASGGGWAAATELCCRHLVPGAISSVSVPADQCATCFCEMPFRRGLYSALGCRPSPHRHIGDSVSGSEGGNSPDCFSLSRLAAPPQDSYSLCCGLFLANLLFDVAFYVTRASIATSRALERFVAMEALNKCALERRGSSDPMLLYSEVSAKPWLPCRRKSASAQRHSPRLLTRLAT